MPSQTTLQSHFDAIVIGGGHNGLVAAGYLAKAGYSVLVLEKREMVGGAAVTEEFFPGFKFSSLADEGGELAPDMVADLNLAAHGYQVIPAEPLVLSLQPDGHHLTIWTDIERTCAEIARFSGADAKAYPKFVEWMRKLSRIVAEMNNLTPPDLPEMGWGNLTELTGFIGPVRGLGRQHLAQVVRTLPMSVADLLGEWFQSAKVKAALGASAVLHTSLGPQEINSTAYTFLQRWSVSNTDLFRSSGQVQGGLGGLTQALAASASNLGVAIHTGAEVVSINMKAGKATGVTLAGGEQISAGVVVSAADARTTFLNLVDPYYLGPRFVRYVRNIKYQGTLARVHFALDRLPQFSGINGGAEELLSGHIQIAPTLTYIQKAYDPTKYGSYSERPYLDFQIPSLTDPALAPDGQHVMSVSVKYMPYNLRDGHWDELRETVAQLVIKTLAEYAPDISECIRESKVITPLDMERDYHLPEGHPTHGEMSLNQFMWMRPIPGYAQYRAPVGNLYMCSAATHPGGGMTGISGRNATREIIKDLK